MDLKRSLPVLPLSLSLSLSSFWNRAPFFYCPSYSPLVLRVLCLNSSLLAGKTKDERIPSLPILFPLWNIFLLFSPPSRVLYVSLGCPFCLLPLFFTCASRRESLNGKKEEVCPAPRFPPRWRKMFRLLLDRRRRRKRRKENSPSHLAFVLLYRRPPLANAGEPRVFSYAHRCRCRCCCCNCCAVDGAPGKGECDFGNWEN